MDNTILLTTPAYPYPTLPANDSLTDATGQRFTKGDDLFTIISHTHCFANHILAQNVSVPAVCLEYPRWDDFTAEVDKGYGLIGISFYPVHMDRVLQMCQYVRRRSPATRIMLGSYGAMAFAASFAKERQAEYADDVILGEGVTFLRQYLGEDTARPIQQRLMPKAGGSPPFITRYPRGTIGFLVSGLGCIGGCDFCSTTAMFNRRRTQLLSPAELIEHIHLYHQHFPTLKQVFVIEEDHFRYPEYLFTIRDFWGNNPEVVEDLDWFAFGSVDHIGRFAEKHGWDALADIGIGCIFIGVESKLAGEHGYKKRATVDARTVFERLHGMGIRTVGAWMCGWDWQDHSNMYEDLNYFVALCPTYQQLTRVSPFPGTTLWERLREEGRVRDVPWEDVHFWSGAQKNVHLEAHETLNLTEYGYDLLYRTWGPSLLRRLYVELDGYAYCIKSENPVLRRHKARFFKKQCAMLWTSLYAMDRFAPNGVVRRRVRKADEQYRRVLGEPTPVMKTLGRFMEAGATAFKLKSFFDPLNRSPKEEPFKRYTYEKNGNGNGAIPYRTEWPGVTPLATRLDRTAEAMTREVLEGGLKAVRAATWRQGDRLIDDCLINMMAQGGMGFGF
ncbi:MAG: hypothetical protein HYV63_03040 [Candidatus Schekmanbacteria bacterium]|nr:hypothetical protein [Candidatus Schekmanbacteria bacterium]